jgi:hypothetical protein
MGEELELDGFGAGIVGGDRIASSTGILIREVG